MLFTPSYNKRNRRSRNFVENLQNAPVWKVTSLFVGSAFLSYLLIFSCWGIGLTCSVTSNPGHLVVPFEWTGSEQQVTQALLGLDRLLFGEVEYHCQDHITSSASTKSANFDVCLDPTGKWESNRRPGEVCTAISIGLGKNHIFNFETLLSRLAGCHVHAFHDIEHDVPPGANENDKVLFHHLPEHGPIDLSKVLQEVQQHVANPNPSLDVELLKFDCQGCEWEWAEQAMSRYTAKAQLTAMQHVQNVMCMELNFDTRKGFSLERLAALLHLIKNDGWQLYYRGHPSATDAPRGSALAPYSELQLMQHLKNTRQWETFYAQWQLCFIRQERMR